MTNSCPVCDHKEASYSAIALHNIRAARDGCRSYRWRNA